MIAWLIVIFIVLYIIRVILFLAWAHKVTEDTIRHSNKFSKTGLKNANSTLFLGDSLTFGTGASTPDKSIAGLYSKDHPKQNIHNHAINRQTSAQLASSIEDQIEGLSNIKRIILSIGGNDVLRFYSMKPFRENMETILSTALEHTKHVYIFTSTKPGKAPLLIDLLLYLRLKRMREIVMSLANKNIHHVDLWIDGDKILANPDKYFVHDRIHLSDAGQKYWYDALKKVMNKK